MSQWVGGRVSQARGVVGGQGGVETVLGAQEVCSRWRGGGGSLSGSRLPDKAAGSAFRDFSSWNPRGN